MEDTNFDRTFYLIQCFIEYVLKNNILDAQEYISYCNSFNVENCKKILSRDENAAQSLGNEMHPNGITATLDLAAMAGIRTDAHVLDIGCGHGGASRILAEHYPAASFVGADSDPLRVLDSIFRSKNRGLDNLEFRLADAYDMPFEDMTFDNIIRQHSVYGGDERVFIKECCRILKPKGRIAFQGVLCMKPFKTKKAFMDDYSIDEYKKLLSDSGFDLIETETENSTKELMTSVENSNRSYYELVKNGILIGIKLTADKK